MSISFVCLSCTTQLRVKDEAAGKKVKCPRCGTATAVPARQKRKSSAADPSAPGDGSRPHIRARASKRRDTGNKFWLWVAGGTGLGLLAVAGIVIALNSGKSPDSSGKKETDARVSADTKTDSTPNSPLKDEFPSKDGTGKKGDGEGGTSGPTDFYGKKVTVLKMFGQRRLGDAAILPTNANVAFHAAGVAVDRSLTPTAFYVVDTGHSRVLGYRSYQSKKADLIFGQPDERSGAANGDCNLGMFGPPTSTSLCLLSYPGTPNVGEAWQRMHHDVDAEGNLYVPDAFNDRVLVYYAPFSADKSGGKGDTVADLVLGQKDFVSNGPNRGRGLDQRDASSLVLSGGRRRVQTTAVVNEGPVAWGVSVDSRGDVWVADTFNGRVLRFPKGQTTADLVLGQKDFTSRKVDFDGQEPPYVTMATPVIARVNPDDGELFVIDGGHVSRIVVFKPPFKNGMAADRLLAIKQPAQGDYAKGYELIKGTSIVFNTFKTDDWIDPNQKKHRYRDGLLWVCDDSRCMLLDKSGDILLVIGAPDTVTRGGRFDMYGRSGLKPEADYNLIWPGGMLGIDSDNNIYLADSARHHVSRYALPYRTGTNAKGQKTMPPANGGLLGGHGRDAVHFNLPLAMFVFKNQLIVRDVLRIMVWNDYLKKPLGAPADLFIGQDGGDNIRKSNNIIDHSRHALDDKDRLWVGSQHGRMALYQLPFTAASEALREQIPLYWADEPDKGEIKCRVHSAAFDPVNRHLWVSDQANNRLLRIRNPDDWKGKLLVDAVLGQPDKESRKGNRGQKERTATGMAKVCSLRFDRVGNFFVVDNTYEGENCRVLAFLAEDLKNLTGMFPNTPAKRIYCADRFDSRDQDVHRMKLALTQPHPFSPVSVAFNRKNEMLLGNDGYWGDPKERAIRQLYLYRKPLEKATPDAVIELPLGAASEMWFDEEDNLVVLDPIYQKVWVINFERDPAWLKPLP